MSNNLTDIIGQADSDRSAGDQMDIDSFDAAKQLEFSKIQRYKADTESRKWLAQWAAAVVTLWLVAVLVILLKNTEKKLGLSDAVLSVLLGTTTLNILGLMFIVLRGYFPNEEKPKS